MKAARIIGFTIGGLFGLALLLGLSMCHHDTTPELPELIGAYTPYELIWVNTKTFEVTFEDEDTVVYHGVSLADALDYTESLTAEFSRLVDILPCHAFILGNPRQAGPHPVYRSMNNDYLKQIGWLYAEEDSDEWWDYQYSQLDTSIILHRTSLYEL